MAQKRSTPPRGGRCSFASNLPGPTPQRPRGATTMSPRSRRMTVTPGRHRCSRDARAVPFARRSPPPRAASATSTAPRPNAGPWRSRSLRSPPRRSGRFACRRLCPARRRPQARSRRRALLRRARALRGRSAAHRRCSRRRRGGSGRRDRHSVSRQARARRGPRAGLRASVRRGLRPPRCPLCRERRPGVGRRRRC